MHQSVVVESLPSYFTSNHQTSSSTISLSNGEVVNYNDFDNYTMHTIQQKIIETSSSTSATNSHPLIQKQNTNSITNGGFPSSTEKHRTSSHPDLNEESRLYRQNTDVEAKDSNGQPFRQNRSNKYGHVKSKVDSNLHNLSLRRQSGRKPQHEEASTPTTDTNGNSYSLPVNQSTSSSFTSPPSNSSTINHNNKDMALGGKESRIQTGLTWRKPTILVGPSTTHHLDKLHQQQQRNNNRMRSFSASPNVQHTDLSSSSTIGKSSLEPIKSEFSPLRSRSASMEYSLQPNDFDTYLQKSTNIIMANGEGNGGDNSHNEQHRNSKDSIRLYRSYLHKKRNPLPDMDDVFESRMKELEQRNATIQQQPQQFPSVFETQSKQTNKDYNQEQKPEDFVRVMPLIPPTLPRFELSHAPSKKMARPISENFTSSTDRRAHMSSDLPSIHQQQRPASEYYQTSQSADMNNNNRLSFSLPDPRSSDLYHHQRHQDQHYQFRDNHKDTFNYLKGDYLKDAISLESAQKKTDLSQSLSRQAGMILQRLQEQQQQREQHDDLQRRQLEEKNAKEKEKKLKEQRRLATAADEIKTHHQQQQQKQQQRVDEQKKYHEQLGDQYRFYEHQRKLREQQEHQRATAFDTHHQQQQQQQQQVGDEFQTSVLPATVPQKPNEGNNESNSSLRKAELSLAENIRFLKQLQSHHNKSLPPIPLSTNIFKSTTSSQSTNDQSPTTLPLTWGRQDTMDLLKHSKFNRTNKSNIENNINIINSNNSHINNTDIIGVPAPKKSALKRNNRNSNTLRGMAPSYFNYATSSYLSSSQSDVSKPPKKSVKIVLEKNSFHFYPKDIW